MDKILADLAAGKFVIQQVRTACGWCDYYTIRTQAEAEFAVRECENSGGKFRKYMCKVLLSCESKTMEGRDNIPKM